MPSEREEIKDRIIMKLEDELINTKIELKEANIQIQRLTKMQWRGMDLKFYGC